MKKCVLKSDRLTCTDKEEAKLYIDAIGSQYIDDLEFLPEGEVVLILKDGWKNDKHN